MGRRGKVVRNGKGGLKDKKLKEGPGKKKGAWPAFHKKINLGKGLI